MDEPAKATPFAWQPLTPKGVSAFAGASFGRVLLLQFIVALLAAATSLWFLQTDWFPVIHNAIAQLPDQGGLRAGRFDFGADSPQRLAGNRFLAVAVDLEHSGEAHSGAHLEVELGRKDFKIFSLLGFVQCDYRPEWAIPLNRTELTPWWGAWGPPILALAGVGVILGLMVTWGCLATLYGLLAWLVGYFANRDLSLGGSWRLAGAALLPGALLQIAAILAYSLAVMDLLGLAVTAALHFIVEWFYLLAGTFAVPRHSGVAATKANPFAAPDGSGK